MYNYHNRKKFIYSLFLLLLLAIGIGYAYLTSNLSISGNTQVSTNTWNIHFENIQVKEGSVIATTSPTLSNNDTSITYTINLNRPKEYYEFTVDVKNDGTLPGKISVSTLSGLDTTSSKVIDYIVTYTGGNSVYIGDILNAGAKKTIKVRVFYKDDISETDFPATDLNLTLTYTLQYVQSENDENVGNVLQNLSTNNSCIIKYDGAVTDQVGVTKTAENVYFDECTDRRHIIFGGYCWIVVRTTETGGVKVLYNGEAVDNKCLGNRPNFTGVSGSGSSTLDLSSSHIYGSSFTYDTANNEFTLTDTTTATWSDSTYEDLIGKYVCFNNVSTCDRLYYINEYKSNTSANANSYTLYNVYYFQIARSSYHSSSDSPAYVGYMYNKAYVQKYFSTLESNVKFGNNFTYDSNTNTYTLSGSTIIPSSIGGIAKDRRYTCWNETGICNTISFIVNNKTSYAYYVEFTGGKNIKNIVDEMLVGDNINRYNSPIKGIVDQWFSNNLIEKSDKIEDTVYCNARNVINYGSWDSNFNGYADLEFKNYSIRSKDLTCPNQSDQFSVNNNKAKLTYPIALVENEEIRNYSSNSFFSSRDSSWTMTPTEFSLSNSTSIAVLYDNGDAGHGNTSYNRGVRPVISLKSNNVISSGTGSESDPWIID